MNATKAQRRRFNALRDLGCIVCGEHYGYYQPPDIHHLTEGYRLGHDSTIPLCPHHHRNVPPDGLTCKEAEQLMGPSLAANKSAFVATYGTERELLAKTDELLRVTI